MEEHVDLVVNAFERNCRRVLAPGFFPEIERQNLRPFARKIALINNVVDKTEVENLAKKLVELGDINAYYFVADYINDALKMAGLTVRDLGRIPHYTDCSLVAVYLAKDWLLYWDGEIRLKEPVNWIDPAIELFKKDSRIFVANPNWCFPGLDDETWETKGSFALGYGLSDQCYLVKKSDIGRPIYKYRAPISLRYPMIQIEKIFEARLDSYMRTHNRLRATYKNAVYIHPDNEGSGYPKQTITEQCKMFFIRRFLKMLRFIPGKNPLWKI